MPSIQFVKEFQKNRERESRRLALALANPQASTVTLITKENCPACGPVKDYLLAEQVVYEELVVDHQPAAVERLRQLAATGATPVLPIVVYQTHIVMGTDRPGLADLVALYAKHNHKENNIV